MDAPRWIPTRLPEAITRRPWRALAVALAAIPLLVFATLAAVFWAESGSFRDHRVAEPGRLWARPLDLAVGQPATAPALAGVLETLGYTEAQGMDELRPGRYAEDAGTLRLVSRRAPGPPGSVGVRQGARLEVEIADGRVAAVRVDGEPLAEGARFRLGHPPLASYHSPTLRDARWVPLEEIPEVLVQAVLAAEDARFWEHPGLSPRGVARAALANLRQGEVRQGGSTITQQLAKNLYLDRERTLGRKLREANLAVLLEMRTSKRKILQAYLNEVYLGSSGPVSVLGVGSAAWAWFGRDVRDLGLAESALLAGMIHAPGRYSPQQEPRAAVERRNWVISRMLELGSVEPAAARAAMAAPLGVAPASLQARHAPYFAEAVREEARQRFGIDDLGEGGYHLVSTLDLLEQRLAEEAVRTGLDSVGPRWEGSGSDQLQAALVSVHPDTGAVRAWVGGRDYATSQFDRVSQAQRQAGSAFKPVVYAAAFADGRAFPSDVLRDSPITVSWDRTRWRPRNSDGSFRGLVTVRQAAELSLNVPTVRLAVSTGLPRVRQMGRDMGIESPLEAMPSMVLGAFTVNPLDLARVYSTLASGGRRPTLHGLERVVRSDGREVHGADVPSAVRVLPPDAAYLVTSMLQGVLDRGTGWTARREGVVGRLAGKTGTSDDRRDSWFAGYSPDRVTVVWVGYDDNSSSSLSGARAALPLWSRFTRAVAPAGGYPDFARPPGFVAVALDPETGQRATDFCPRRVIEHLPSYRVPFEECQRHRPAFDDTLWALYDHDLEAAPAESDSLAAAIERARRDDDVSGDAPSMDGDLSRPSVRLPGDVEEIFGEGSRVGVRRRGEVAAGDDPPAPPAPATELPAPLDPPEMPAPGAPERLEPAAPEPVALPVPAPAEPL